MSKNEHDDNAEAALEILQRGLIKISMIGEGQDELLDQQLNELRKALKKNQLHAVEVLITTISDRVVSLERSHSSDAAQTRSILRELASEWLAFSLDKNLQKNISNYLAALPAQLYTPKEFLEFIIQLRDIQAAAIAQLQQEHQGLLGKFFSKKQLAPIQEPVYIEVFEEKSFAPELNCSHLLHSLIDALKPYYPDENHLEVVRRRLVEKRSFDAVAVVQQLNGFIQHILQNSSSTFKQYLDGVSQELAELNRLLQHNVGVDEVHENRRKDWHEAFTKNMVSFEQATQDSVEVNELKSNVQRQIAHLRESLADLRQVDKDQQQLSYLLTNLVQKVKNLEAQAEINQEQLAKQKYRANHDALTGLPNRYAYEERIAIELQRFTRFDRPSVIAMFDIDHFKHINDEHGHSAGDRVIKIIGSLMSKRLRKVDFFGRYGGEEFIAILPETDVQQASLLLNKIREAISKLAFNYKEKPLHITVSIGVAEFKKDDTPETLFERADAALYEAKHAGRNCLKVK